MSQMFRCKWGFITEWRRWRLLASANAIISVLGLVDCSTIFEFCSTKTPPSYWNHWIKNYILRITIRCSTSNTISCCIEKFSKNLRVLGLVGLLYLFWIEIRVARDNCPNWDSYVPIIRLIVPIRTFTVTNLSQLWSINTQHFDTAEFACFFISVMRH